MVELKSNEFFNEVYDVNIRNKSGNLKLSIGEFGDLILNVYGDYKKTNNKKYSRSCSFYVDKSDEEYDKFDSFYLSLIYDENSEYLLCNNSIEFYSDGVSLDKANKLIISKFEDGYCFDFYDAMNDFTDLFTVKIYKEDSRYFSLKNSFFDFFGKFQKNKSYIKKIDIYNKK